MHHFDAEAGAPHFEFFFAIFSNRLLIKMWHHIMQKFVDVILFYVNAHSCRQSFCFLCLI
jgi:hypothetical protein